MEEKKEIDELIDELVAKAGPTAGQIKLNQDPIKVERLLALGWKPKEPTEKSIQETIGTEELSKVQIVKRLEALEKTVAINTKRIDECSIRR